MTISLIRRFLMVRFVHRAQVNEARFVAVKRFVKEIRIDDSNISMIFSME